MYPDLLQQAQASLAAEAKKKLKDRLTRDEIARRAGVSKIWLKMLRMGRAPNAAYSRIQAVLRVLAEGKEHDI